MPLTHLRTFRVRYCECDAFGYLDHTNYLRYMQETAFDASAAGGFDKARYDTMGRVWLVRETEIEHLRPLRYADSVRVKTWVAEFRRVRSRRMYEFRLEGSQELVARAYTDWAFLDKATGRPAPIPPELVAAFFPEGSPGAPKLRSRFSYPSPPPTGILTFRRRVEWRDIDEAGHVNNAVYMAYVEDCGMRAAAAHGWPLVRMQAEGFVFVARRHHIAYRQPAVLDDELELATWLSDVEPTSAVRHYTITRLSNGASLARARTVLEWVKVETGEPANIPAAFLSKTP
jgi:acyl-CoA thioester hydrolase